MGTRRMPLRYRTPYTILWRIMVTATIVVVWIFFFGNPRRSDWPHLLDLWGVWYFIKYGTLYVLSRLFTA